jgi:hypothetical protein
MTESINELREKFLEKLQALVTDLYRLGDGRRPSDEWKLYESRVRGFCEAGLTLGVVTGDAIQVVIDTVYLAQFGEHREKRSASLDKLEQQLEAGNWSSFETPAFTRRAIAET